MREATTVPESLDTLSAALGGAESFEDFAQAAAGACARAAQAEVCAIWRVYVDEGDKQRLRLAGAYGIDQRQLLAQMNYEVTPGASQYDGVTGYIASERQPVLVHSYDELLEKYKFCHKGKMDDIQWQSRARVMMRNLYAVPLVLDDQLQGVLKIENRKGTGSFTDDDVSVVNALAARIALVVKSLVLLDSHERRLIDAPTELAEALVKRPFETDQLTQDIVNTTAKTLDAEVCSLWLVDGQGKNLVHQADFGFRGGKGAVPSYRIDVTGKDGKLDDSEIEGLTAWVAIRRRPFWANSYETLSKHPSWAGRWDKSMWGGKGEAATRFHSMYAVPLIWNNDLLGVLKVENPKNSAYFSRNDHRKCDLMANYVVLLLALTKQARLQLVPAMAHNLMEPSETITSNLEQLERELEKPVLLHERIRDRMNSLKLLNLTVVTLSQTLAAEVAARAGAQPPKRVDLLAFIDKRLAIVRPVAPFGITVRVRAELADPFLRLRPLEETWLGMVMFNLVHNAIKHSPADGVVEVLMVDGPGEGELTIDVSDTGPGVPVALRERIFDAGFTTRVPPWPDGTGLGLYEVRRLLHELGWHIHVEDNTPKGARFVVVGKRER